MKKLFWVLILVCIVLLGNEMFNTSFAYDYDIYNSVLFYKEDYEELEVDIERYLENIDDVILVNSSFLYGDELIENYDFLVHFALDYILNNREYYYQSLKEFDYCSYSNKFGVFSSTNEYVDLDVLYDVTDFYFGVKDFVIINDDVCFRDNYISLSNYSSGDFSASIVNVEVNSNNDGIDALVYYDNDSKYLYSFYVVNNILKIKNVEVVI